DPRFNTTTDVQFIPNMDGFPNGRRLEDDVTRIELQAVAGVVLAAVGLWYDDFDPATDASPVTQDLLDVLTYSTGVETNDRPFQSTFPYLAMPWRGTEIGSTGDNVTVTGGGSAATAATFFVSSNNQSAIGIYDVKTGGGVEASTFTNVATDADGLFYVESDDVLYQLNRSDNVVDAYSNFLGAINDGMMPQLTATSTADFSNGREIAVNGNQLVVAQDATDENDGNKLLLYNISPTAITLVEEYPVDINLWGIFADGNTLYAIVDNSADLAVFDNFFTAPSSTPDRIITVEGIFRTHGLTYIAERDMMILTDVGSGANPADGAFTVVRNYTDAAADGRITATEQIRIEGSATFLGNPVDVIYVEENDVVYIAERANGGGRVLGFTLPAVGSTGGNIAPVYNVEFAGASAIAND
ncbi:MAG: DUF4331 family protein, partial [Bacteroidota bacterium]